MPVVKLYANLRKLAGTKELPAKGDTVGSVLSDLIGQHAELREALLEHGELRPHVILTLNGQHPVRLDTPVEEQDVIAIFPPIAGGG